MVPVSRDNTMSFLWFEHYITLLQAEEDKKEGFVGGGRVRDVLTSSSLSTDHFSI